MAEKKQPSNLFEEIYQTPGEPSTPTPTPISKRSRPELVGQARYYFQKFAVSRRSWPELLGQTAEEAEKKIKEEMPFAMVQVIPKDNFVTRDLRINRVRIFVDSSGNVAKAPIIG